MRVGLIIRKVLTPSIILTMEDENQEPVKYSARKIKVLRSDNNRYCLTFKDVNQGKTVAMMLDACVYMR